jgi:hypothetical protein
MRPRLAVEHTAFFHVYIRTAEPRRPAPIGPNARGPGVEILRVVSAQVQEAWNTWGGGSSHRDLHDSPRSRLGGAGPRACHPIRGRPGLPDPRDSVDPCNDPSEGARPSAGSSTSSWIGECHRTAHDSAQRFAFGSDHLDLPRAPRGGWVPVHGFEFPRGWWHGGDPGAGWVGQDPGTPFRDDCGVPLDSVLWPLSEEERDSSVRYALRGSDDAHARLRSVAIQRLPAPRSVGCYVRIASQSR